MSSVDRNVNTSPQQVEQLGMRLLVSSISFSNATVANQQRQWEVCLGIWSDSNTYVGFKTQAWSAIATTWRT